MKLTPTKLAKHIGISRAAVYKAIDRGELQREPDGNFDLDNEFNKAFLSKRAALDLEKSEKKEKELSSAKSSKKEKKSIIEQKSVEIIDENSEDDEEIENLIEKDISSLNKLKVVEQIEKMRLEAEIKREKFIEKELIRTLLAKIYEIHMNEFLTAKDKLMPDIAAIFDTTNQAKIIKSGERIDEELWKILQSIKTRINKFLNDMKAGRIE